MFPKNFFLAVPLLLLFAGCGSNQPHCQTFEGLIMQQGRPLGEARVVFHAQSIPNASVSKPQGITDESGRYSVTVCSTDPNPALGNYKITVELRAPRKVGEESVRDGKNLLPSIYAKPATTPFKFELAVDAEKVPPISLD